MRVRYMFSMVQTNSSEACCVRCGGVRVVHDDRDR